MSDQWPWENLIPHPTTIVDLKASAQSTRQQRVSDLTTRENTPV
jgi:hypothetical protein